METTRHKARLLKSSQVPAAAFGQGGRRDWHLLEAEESLVGAESCCQCRDPCAADGVALETETNGEGVRMGQPWPPRWAAGSCLGWKVPVSLRKGHLPTTGNRGSQGRGTNPGSIQGRISHSRSPQQHQPQPAEGTGFASTLGQPCSHLAVTVAAGSAGRVASVGLGSLSQGQNQGTVTHPQELSALLSKCCSHWE